MSECSLMRERMPLLLTESLDASTRETAHQHIEHCSVCSAEWNDFQETWRILGDVPEVALPTGLRARFLDSIEQRPKSNVIPFLRRPAAKWLAQAAAIAVVVAGSFYAGRESSPRPASPTYAGAPARITDIQPASYSLAENMVLQASSVKPEIEGRPNIQNVRFFEEGTNIGVAFDMTSHVTINGRPDDKSMVRLLSYLLQNQENPTHTRSNAIQWVKDTYSSQESTDPEIVKALANVLKNDAHEGVRIKAVEALRSLPPSLAPEVRIALIEALKNDPNPGVRIKAVEVLANLASQDGGIDAATVDTLRQKASQADENTYVRVKAAEALSQISL
ncbi:MAG TPA: HEAT repeat domain-containing protein [Thermoanaerobaculia bacterium]